MECDAARDSDVLYKTTQTIGDAADFRDFDGIRALGARWPCLNVAILTDRVAPQDLDVLPSTDIHWPEWIDRIRFRRA
ncbi:hypothetical protein SAMN05421720_106160 [Rhodospira trueperi]|uniref:Uncharacterized protein n=1 Tax=Rhodospira trueperi TaxID=69960 RepID=A0A1G7CNZ6_9PROT|nr:hypothetical protein SAMN05421720_106160 [Rhodospira trueperi]